MKAISRNKKTHGMAILILILLFVFNPNANLITAQTSMIHLHFKKARTKKIELRFEMIHNLIIIPAFINGSDTLKFILDTGVSHTMIPASRTRKGSPLISQGKLNCLALEVVGKCMHFIHSAM